MSRTIPAEELSYELQPTLLAAGKIKLESDLTTNTKFNSLWIKGLNIRAKTIKCLLFCEPTGDTVTFLFLTNTFITTREKEALCSCGFPAGWATVRNLEEGNSRGAVWRPKPFQWLDGGGIHFR